MVMLTKIVFDVYNKSNIKIFSEGVQIISRDTKEIDVVQCAEYCRIDISLYSDDDNAYLKVYSIDDIRGAEDIIIPNNQKKTICNFENHKNKLVPGYYCYKLYLSDREINGIYFIKPSSVSWEGLINLREFLNSYLSGLAMNIYMYRKTNKFKKNTSLPPNIYIRYLYIQKNAEMLINNIKQIVNNPLTDLKKKYKESYYATNFDNKSQKWLVTKGILKNTNIYVPELVYSKHAMVDIDIPENRWVKKIIKSIIYFIFNIENKIQIQIKQKENNIEEKKKRVDELKKQFEFLKQSINAGEGRKYEIKTDIRYTIEDIKVVEKKHKLLHMKLLKIRKLKALLISFNKETWLEQICQEEQMVEPTIKLFKDYRYFMLYNFYRDIENLDMMESKFKDIRFSYKDTPTLFEYYAVLLVIEILRDIGFDWIKGWLADSMFVVTHSVTLPTEEPFIFLSENKNIRIELYYEKEIRPDSEVMNANMSDFIRGSLRHYKPDILLATFDNSTNELLTSMIIEVKCYKSRYLVMEEKNIPSRVIEQVRDYSRIEYYDIKKQRKNRANEAIDKVVVVYPRQNFPEEYPYDDRDIKFIQIEANDKEVYKHYGYNELRNEIEEAINNGLN